MTQRQFTADAGITLWQKSSMERHTPERHAESRQKAACTDGASTGDNRAFREVRCFVIDLIILAVDYRLRYVVLAIAIAVGLALRGYKKSRDRGR